MNTSNFPIRFPVILSVVIGVVSASGTGQLCLAQATIDQRVGPSEVSLGAARETAVGFLRSSQSDDGSWTLSSAPGITALVATALMRSGVPASDPVVARSLAHLKTHVKPDGGVYDTRSLHRNYETCISLLAFHEANGDGQYAPLLRNAEKFLRDLQWDQGEGLETSDAGFGGAGYGKHERPDLSNTQFLVEALAVAGADKDDPSLKLALQFISNCQNLESGFNTTEFAGRVNDGGFYYTPAAGGTSQAGLTADGGLRSYGSMTYAGLKSMIYCGLDKDDPRVKAANDWISRFYTVEENPGMGQQGLYYYYHIFARALDSTGINLIRDADGQQHDWRRELAEKLFREQQPNGSWKNAADRWYEGDPNLSTAYSLLSLAYCTPRSVSAGIDK